MFDLITGKAAHMPGGGRGAVLTSLALHTGVFGAIAIVPMLFVANAMPEVPTIMAFVAQVAPPPPPPPPPALLKQAIEKVALPSAAAAPVEAPSSIQPEPPGLDDDEGVEGVFGGIEGGVPGGTVGEIVGGLEPAPPPPPPPPQVPREPIRIGGDIHPPTLLQRVEPIYPDLAVRARVEGTVILEAIIDEEGAVRKVKVLRSVALLDKAAVEAVEQWRYAPVVLNGRPIPVILTVVVSFRFP